MVLTHVRSSASQTFLQNTGFVTRLADRDFKNEHPDNVVQRGVETPRLTISPILLDFPLLAGFGPIIRRRASIARAITSVIMTRLP